MLYVGHFSFNEDSIKEAGDSQLRHGYFTCGAEAKDADEALKKFETLLESLKREGDLFDGVEEIYLDAGIEIRSIPPNGFLAYFTQRVGEDIGGISTSVGAGTLDQASAFGMEPNDGAPDTTQREITVLIFDSSVACSEFLSTVT